MTCQRRKVVSYASGPYYRAGQARLLASLARWNIASHHACDADRFTPHHVVPYYFKAEIVHEASLEADSLLWLDASAVVNGPLDPLFEIVEQQGYLLFDNGWRNSTWCSDRSLAAFGFTRDEAEGQPQVFGALTGYSCHHPLGRWLIDEYLRHKDLFRGRHDNRDHTESQDPRCLGHRHDQSVLALVAAKYRYQLLPFEKWVTYDNASPHHLVNIRRRDMP